MPSLAPGITFDTSAREWRLKWATDTGASAGNDKAVNMTPLTAVQTVLSQTVPFLKKVTGLVRVQRVVCGGCYDFKVLCYSRIARAQQLLTNQLTDKRNYD